MEWLPELMKAGILYADRNKPFPPSHAHEIMTAAEYGCINQDPRMESGKVN